MKLYQNDYTNALHCDNIYVEFFQVSLPSFPICQ